MKTNHIFSALCLSACFGTMPGSALAQSEHTEGADSTKHFFNALDHRLQRRYIPQGRKIDTEVRGKNVSLSAVGGALKVRSGLPMVYSGGIGISKEVSSFNTYRVVLAAGFNDRFKQASIEVDHLFNLSDYLAGYKSGAHWNLYTVAGIGGHFSKKEGQHMQFSGALHGGLQLTYHLGNHWDWFLEPKLYLFTDRFDGLVCNKRYDLAYGVTTGLTYRFTGLPVAPKSEDAGDNLFIEAGIGVQGDYSGRIREHLSGMQIAGPSASLSIGKWFMPLGVRATLFGGYHHTVSPEQLKTKEAYAGGRVEAMMNLNTLLKPSVTDPRFEVNVSGGYELGALAHRSPSYSGSLNWFHGPTGAVQLMYFVSEQVGIFGEARYSLNHYTQSFKELAAQDRSMRNISALIGVQYRRRKERFDARRNLFQPHNFVYATLGTNAPFRSGISLHDLGNVLGQQVGLGFGRQYTPVSAVRGGIEIARYPDPRNVPYPLSISADYLLNITNLIDNYNEARIFNLSAFAGLVYTHHDLADKHYLGVQGGLQQEFNLSEHWGIYLEEYVRGYKGRITPSARYFTKHQFTFVPGCNLGLKYRF